jgi:acyl-CoA oxidase
MGLLFLPLSGGRAGICEMTTTYAVIAISIAIRYSASRKQFGPEGSDSELPIIEYQAQQYRTIPHLAEAYAMKFFSNWINLEYGKMLKALYRGENPDKNLIMEMHAISSTGKAICSWMARDLIQDCREACGGHGYLKCAGLGDLRNDNDPNCTYEGENNVLTQQTSNYLINLRAKGWKSFEKADAIGTCGFLKDGEEILRDKWSFGGAENALEPQSE